jgi:hypothetical protein
MICVIDAQSISASANLTVHLQLSMDEWRSVTDRRIVSVMAALRLQCFMCEAVFYGRADARYCCGACRQKAHRVRARVARRTAIQAQGAAARRSARGIREHARAARESAQRVRESRAAVIATPPVQVLSEGEPEL